MAIRTVTQSAANAMDGSFLWELAGIVNSIAATLNAMQGDALLSAPGVAIGTSDAAEVKHNAVEYQIDGVRYQIPAGEVAFTATSHDIADPDSDPREAIYVLSVGPNDTEPTITKGTTAAEDAAVAPATPTGHIKLGEVLIQHDGTAIFDATTNDLDAAHLTSTFSSETPSAVAAAEVDTIATREGGTPD